MQKDGRILYLTEGKRQNLYWNVPIANTTVILLGTGTSITQAAVRMLVSAGVMIGFCGGGVLSEKAIFCKKERYVKFSLFSKNRSFDTSLFINKTIALTTSSTPTNPTDPVP